MGRINIGGKGVITIDGKEYEMNPRDGIYVGMGNKEISFKSCDEKSPAKFYVSSCPAHYETTKKLIAAGCNHCWKNRSAIPSTGIDAYTVRKRAVCKTKLF